MHAVTGVVAAGHPLTAEAGAGILRDGGNAVDAALACVMCAFAAEPLLTGLAAGGYMLVGTPDGRDELLDFFCAAAGRGRAPDAPRADLVEVDVSFGATSQRFFVGAPSVAAYGMPAGIVAAHGRWGTLPLERLAAPGIAAARDGVVVNAQQAYLADILGGIVASDDTGRAVFEPDGASVLEGQRVAYAGLADALARLVEDGAEPFYRGDVAQAVCADVGERGGVLTAADLAAYEPVWRDPVRVGYRGRTVITNPPPSAGGALIAQALAQLDAVAGPPDVATLVAALRTAQEGRASRLGSTTHVSVIDGDGWACSVTVSNGEGSGVVVPGTGLHLNNMMGEEDLSPAGFFTQPAGARMPSMMAPTLVRDGAGTVTAAVGSAGSNRIRSAIVGVLSRLLDEGLEAEAAVLAPRVHWEAQTTYAEPGIDAAALEAAGHTVLAFGARNLFFGGAQCVARGPAGELTGAGDPRRGGVAVVA